MNAHHPDVAMHGRSLARREARFIHRVARGRLVSVLLVSLVAACGRSPTAPTPLMSGVWQGSIQSGADGPGTITLRVTQTGLSVEGTVLLSQDTIVDVPGTLTGKLSSASFPTTLEYVVTYEYGPFQCHGTFSGTAIVADRTIDGIYSGENCVLMFTGELKATRVE